MRLQRPVDGLEDWIEVLSHSHAEPGRLVENLRIVEAVRCLLLEVSGLTIRGTCDVAAQVRLELELLLYERSCHGAVGHGLSKGVLLLRQVAALEVGVSGWAHAFLVGEVLRYHGAVTRVVDKVIPLHLERHLCDLGVLVKLG